ncbi:hypothetical protein GF356_06490 [candidate division GN15 bacterium]|nr:hypothetical protein [candidate division GN15 bacterium]
MSRAKQLKRSLVFHLTHLLHISFNRLPRRLARFLGGWIALAAWFFITKDQHKVHRHLSLAYGDRLTDSQKRVLGREFYVNTGRFLVDVMRCRRHYEREIRPYVTVVGRRHLDEAYGLGRGVVCVTGHIGAYELLAVHMAIQGYPVAVVGRKLYESRLDRLLVDHRLAMGLVNYTTTDPPARLLSWLRTGGLLGVLIDTDSPRVRGEHLSMFARPAYTPVGQTILAMRAGAPIVCMVCMQTPQATYRIEVAPPIDTRNVPHTQESVHRITQQCVEQLQHYIEKDLSQWIWLHNRWHTRYREFA